MSEVASPDPRAEAPVAAGLVVAGLVVEDDPPSRSWLAEGLRSAFGAIPVSAVDGVAPARAWLRGEGRKVAAGSAGNAGAGCGLVVLIDLGLPDGSGTDIIRDLARDFPAALPVVTTIYDDDAHLFEAIAAGAAGYLLKDSDGAVLADYLRRIHRGEPPLSPSIARRILTSFRSPAFRNAGDADLTPRERDVLALLGRGLRTAEAAQVLKVSEHTVATHVKAIYGKLNISSRAEAALEARNRGLV